MNYYRGLTQIFRLLKIYLGALFFVCFFFHWISTSSVLVAFIYIFYFSLSPVLLCVLGILPKLFCLSFLFIFQLYLVVEGYYYNQLFVFLVCKPWLHFTDVRSVWFLKNSQCLRHAHVLLVWFLNLVFTIIILCGHIPSAAFLCNLFILSIASHYVFSFVLPNVLTLPMVLLVLAFVVFRRSS